MVGLMNYYCRETGKDAVVFLCNGLALPGSNEAKGEKLWSGQSADPQDGGDMLLRRVH
jgi:hypothetical protein